jgi:hypothetical protein
MNKIIIDWVPYSATGRNWWVYSLPLESDGLETKGGNAPTANLQGQFQTIEEAQSAFPNAQLTDSAQKAMKPATE